MAIFWTPIYKWTQLFLFRERQGPSPLPAQMPLVPLSGSGRPAGRAGAAESPPKLSARLPLSAEPGNARRWRPRELPSALKSGLPTLYRGSCRASHPRGGDRPTTAAVGRPIVSSPEIGLPMLNIKEIGQRRPDIGLHR